MHKTMRSLFILMIVICSTLMIGCGSRVPVIKPFKLDIQQGNVVTSKMLLQLRPGMTKSQVKFIMGTPLVVDSFHTNRWDYFYQLRQAGKIIEQRRVILDFEKELLARVRGDVVPQGTPGAESAVALASETSVIPKPVVKEGLLENLQFWKNNQSTAVEQATAAEQATKPKVEEKGLLDKLKFWQADKPVTQPNVDAGLKPKAIVEAVEPVKEVLPAAVPIVAAPVIAADVLSPDATASEAEKPSMLAVPIELGPSDNAQAAITATENVPSVVEQTKAATTESAPTVNDVAKEMAQETTVSESQPNDSAPAVMNGEERFIFRFDRKLNPKNLESVQTPALPPKETLPTLKANPGKEIPAPVAEEPGYFERMLEKIGF
ncbi:MAG: outer membrane protein assembly factor BamE [Methylotenera sp.]|nr:MAG: outer membrane protein assembly factor BamE [Methylotenera sp.]